MRKPLRMPMPMPLPQSMPLIAGAKKNEHISSCIHTINSANTTKGTIDLNNKSFLVGTVNKVQQQQQQQESVGAGEEGTEGGAVASQTGSSSSSETSTDSASTTGDKDGNFIISKKGKQDIFRVVRKNIRKIRRN